MDHSPVAPTRVAPQTLVSRASISAASWRLTEDFLRPYRAKGDPFASLLARATFHSKYSRQHQERDGAETWTDTIRRVVEGSLALDTTLSRSEREAEGEKLFKAFWHCEGMPPGRGLWVGGVEGIPADARYNCWSTTVYDIEDWCWAMNQLMLGGGVGIGLSHVDQMPGVSGAPCRFAVWCRSDHPNVGDVKPNDKHFLNGSTPVFRAPDSREGWVEAFRRTCQAAWEGRDLIVDVSDIRARGLPIRTFGGTACGPGPLTHLLRSVHAVIRRAAGSKLASIDALDITNYIGFCVKAGNVRRSALIVVGDAHDQAFRDAKKDVEALMSHRHTSNNSIAFRERDALLEFDWAGLVEDNIQFGEPGILNLLKIWESDPGATGVNPCGEVPLHDREACNLAEVFPAKFDSLSRADEVLTLVTRYALRQKLTPLTDAKSHQINWQNMRLGVGLGGLCDFHWTPSLLRHWYGTVRSVADRYAQHLGVNRPIAVTTVKPSGTISLVCGSSPGVHAPYAPFYIRRSRLSSIDPLVPVLQEAGVPYETDAYDSTGHTLVFSFPMKMINDTKVTVQTETLRSQFERQALVQENWADNSVSSTLSFDPETERDEMAALLKEYAPRFKSTSMLAKSHGYVQPPYEEISASTYYKMVGNIDMSAKLVTGDMEIEECAGGVCPIR